MNPFRRGVIDSEGLANFAKMLDQRAQAERLRNMGFTDTAAVIEGEAIVTPQPSYTPKGEPL